MCKHCLSDTCSVAFRSTRSNKKLGGGGGGYVLGQTFVVSSFHTGFFRSIKLGVLLPNVCPW